MQSKWGMSIYSIPTTNVVPDILKVGTLVGKAEVSIVDFHGLGSIREYVPACPDSWYAWIFWGKVEIKRGGTYTFCSTSDDGSHVYVNGRHIVNNDGASPLLLHTLFFLFAPVRNSRISSHLHALASPVAPLCDSFLLSLHAPFSDDAVCVSPRFARGD